MEHAGRVTRASSPRAFGRLWPSWSTPGRKPEHRAPERSLGSLVALMEHAGEETRTSSPRAFGRLACGSHGARRKGDPSVELPSVRLARLWLSWSTPDGNPSVEPPSVRSARLWLSWSPPDGNPSVEPPSVRSARLWLSWSKPDGNPSVEPPSVRSAHFRAHRCMGDFYPIFE